MHDDAADALNYVLTAMRQTSDYTVFYAELLYGQYHSKNEIPFHEMPDGAYMYNHFTRIWYIKRGSVFEEVPDPELPKTLKGLCLLLNIT